jgi:hypothetical protein
VIAETLVPERRLGRLPAKASRKALQFADFFRYMDVPTKTPKRSTIPLRHYGNHEWGDCTRAKQAVAAVRMERIEQKRTIHVSDEEVIRVYQDMSNRLYGGGDNGAYEDDALSEWRRPETTFKDTNGRPYTIDAFLRINSKSQEEVKAALAFSQAKGIAICFNLPLAWSRVPAGQPWLAPPDGRPIGDWTPGSWGGHSMWCHGYDAQGIIVDQTWVIPPTLVSWDAVALYMDEAHLVIDSVNGWKRMQTQVEPETQPVGALNMELLVSAVNDVSSYKIQERA